MYIISTAREQTPNEEDEMREYVKVENEKGQMVDFDAAVMGMDDELREEIHMDMAPCTAQAFFEEYARRHEERFGEDFIPWVGGAW